MMSNLAKEKNYVTIAKYVNILLKHKIKSYQYKVSTQILIHFENEAANSAILMTTKIWLRNVFRAGC